MKKTVLFILSLMLNIILITQAWGVDLKVTDLAEDTAPTADDLIYVVNAPGGTPTSKKVTVANMRKEISSTVVCAANVCTDVPASTMIIITTDATVGADVLTIAAGVQGDIRTIVLKTDGGTDLDITPIKTLASKVKPTIGII